MVLRESTKLANGAFNAAVTEQSLKRLVYVIRKGSLYVDSSVTIKVCGRECDFEHVPMHIIEGVIKLAQKVRRFQSLTAS